MTETSGVVWFTEPLCRDVRVTGGKGASLATMSAAGLNVPPCFVVRADVLERSLDAGALRRHARAGDYARAQALVREAEPPEAEISAAYERLGGPVAVRSSASAEDSGEASFAGQHDTFLNVRGASETCRLVRECWASFFSERALFYRAAKGSVDDLAIAVVVQRMVEPEKAGVLFTVEPVAGRCDRMLVEAVFGLGEQVVSGEVTPDHYIVDRQGSVQMERLRHGGVLAPTELRRLAALGRELQERLGGPQDVEWAIAEGELYLLQSRPVTTL
jgi:pyruvate,water dikinase